MRGWRKKNVFALIIIVILLALVYLKGWFVLGMMYFNQQKYDESKRAFLRQVAWNPWDQHAYLFLVSINYFENNYDKCVEYIMYMVEKNPDQDLLDELTNYTLKILGASSEAFSREDLRIMLCELPELPSRFLKLSSGTISYYPDKLSLIMSVAKDCELVSLIPELKELVYDDDDLIAKQAGLTLFHLDKQCKLPIWKNMILGDSSKQHMIMEILVDQKSGCLKDLYMNLVEQVQGKMKSFIIGALAKYPSGEMVDFMFKIAKKPDYITDESLFEAMSTLLSITGPGPFLEHEQELIKFCNSYSEPRYKGSASILAKISDKVPEVFLDKLRTEPPEFLPHWIEIIGYFKIEQILVPYLNHTDPKVVVATIEALKHDFSTQVKKIIYELIQHENKEVVKKAIKYIAKDPDKKAVKFLFDMVYDLNDEIALAALTELYPLNPPGLGKLFREFLEHPSPEIRLFIASIFGNSEFNKGQTFNRIIARIPVEKDEKVRAMLVKSIAETKNEKTRKLMQKLLFDPVPAIRIMALKNLTRALPPDKFKLVIPLLDDQDLKVKYQAIDTLAEWNNEKIIPFLEPYLNVSDDYMQSKVCNAIFQLARTKEKKIRLMLKLSMYKDLDIKMYAFLKLQDYRSPEITRRMKKAMDDNEYRVSDIARRFLGVGK